MSLLTIIGAACARISVDVPTSVVANTAKDTVELLHLAKEEGKSLARRTNWKVLTTEKSFAATARYLFTVSSASATAAATYTNNSVTYTVVSTIASGTELTVTGSGDPTVNGTLTKASGTGDSTITFTAASLAGQASALPTDLDWIIPETMFDRSAGRMIEGPISSEEWQLLQSTMATRAFPAFRIRGSNLLITPQPTAGNTIAYEYVSKNWCQSSASVLQSTWAADTDTALIDEELHTLGIIWRFLKMRGLDYSDHYATYESEVRKAIAREGVRRRLSMDMRTVSNVFDYRVAT